MTCSILLVISSIDVKSLTVHYTLFLFLQYKFSLQTLDEAAAKFNIPARWASFDCQNGLYIPKLLKALGFNMETENIFAKRKLDGVKIGM